MTIYKTWEDVFKEPIWTVRDMVHEINWLEGKVNILQSGHTEYQVFCLLKFDLIAEAKIEVKL